MDFFRPELVHRIDITVDPAQWQAYLPSTGASTRTPIRRWYQGNFRIDGADLRNVGFHSFGWGSRDENRNKPNLSLDLDHYVPGQSFRGIERMRLKNNGQDVSGLRQAILYQAMRESSLMAPRSTYAELYVNGAPHGFYFVEESFTQGFVRERTGNANGATFEPAGCQGFVAPRGGCEALADYFESNFNPTWPARPSHLLGLCRVLNGPAEGMIEGVAPYIVLSEWVYQIAIDTALAGNRDGFSTAGANFRLYHDTALNKLRLIVLGPDDTFVPGRPPRAQLPAARALRRLHRREPALPRHLPGEAGGHAQGPRPVPGHRSQAAHRRPGRRRGQEPLDALWTIVGPHAKADPLRNPDYDAEASKDSIKEYVDRRWQALEQAGF